MGTVKFEVWGHKVVGKGQRLRLRFNLDSRASADWAVSELRREGYADLVLSQRPPSYGRLKGIQKGVNRRIANSAHGALNPQGGT